MGWSGAGEEEGKDQMQGEQRREREVTGEGQSLGSARDLGWDRLRGPRGPMEVTSRES